jgi:hypothetical protein
MLRRGGAAAIIFMRVEQQLRDSLKEIGGLKAALDEHAIAAITDPQGKITYVSLMQLFADDRNLNPARI